MVAKDAMETATSAAAGSEGQWKSKPTRQEHAEQLWLNSGGPGCGQSHEDHRGQWTRMRTPESPSVQVERCAAKNWPWWLHNRTTTPTLPEDQRREGFAETTTAVLPTWHSTSPPQTPGIQWAPQDSWTSLAEWQSRVTIPHDSHGID